MGTRLPFKDLGVHFRAANENDDPDDIFQLTYNQTEAQLQKQIQTDKGKAVRKIAEKIHRKKELIKKAKGETKRVLKKELEDSECEQFELLRDEILSACKDSAGLIDHEKLRRVRGSPEYVKAQREKEKTKKGKDKIWQNKIPKIEKQ